MSLFKKCQDLFDYLGRLGTRRVSEYDKNILLLRTACWSDIIAWFRDMWKTLINESLQFLIDKIVQLFVLFYFEKSQSRFDYKNIPAAFNDMRINFSLDI